MKLLLDTHALLWWLLGDEKLTLKTRKAIADQANTVFVSAVCAYEIAFKNRLGKLPDADGLIHAFDAVIDRQGFQRLPVSTAHALRAGLLPLSHRDPFDRLLVAQSLLDDLLLVSNERLFDDFGVARLW